MAKGVEAMLVVTTELGCVLCPLYISCDKTIDVTGETSSNSTGSVFIWKKKKKKKWTNVYTINPKDLTFISLSNILYH